MEDSRIVELYWQKNADAIKETDSKYGAYCFTIADNILHNKEDSEECVNDTWLNAWNAMPPQKPTKLQMFLAKITRNLSFNRFNARSAEKRGGGEIVLVLDELAECLAGESDVESEYEARELGRCIRMFVRALPERDGNVFVRRYFFTEPVAEIAKRYDCFQKQEETHVAEMGRHRRLPVLGCEHCDSCAVSSIPRYAPRYNGPK